jgi:pentatricopeptide repeat protein
MRSVARSITATRASVRPRAALVASSLALPQTCRQCSTSTAAGAGDATTADPIGQLQKRHSFQPFSEREEQDLVNVITTKPRHVLKYVRRMVWRSRKRELHFRATVTQLMIVLQDFLRKQLVDPEHASAIIEGVLEECVKMHQHDMAHLLFRAFLRFRKYNCRISVDALRHLFESYKATNDMEHMAQLPLQMQEDAELRPLCIAAYLFAGDVAAAEKLRQSVAQTDMKPQDLIAVMEGYDRLNDIPKVLEVIDTVESIQRPKDELVDVFASALRIFYRRDDETNFARVFNTARTKEIPFSSASFATTLRMQLRHAQTIDDVTRVEQELRALGYVPDMTGNSVIISAIARMMHYGDKTSEEVMLGKVDTLLTSVETRLKQGDADLDVGTGHLRAIIRGYGAAGKPELMKEAWGRLQAKGLSNDTRVYNELIKWFSLMGNVKDCLQAKYDMAKNDVQADAQTYTWVFRALGKYYPRQADKFFMELQTSRIRPDIALYTTMIGVFGDIERLDRVETIRGEIKQREENGTIQVSPATYAVLLRVFARDLEKVEELFREAQAKSIADHEYVLTSVVHAYSLHPNGLGKLEDLLRTLDPRWPINVFNVLLSYYGKKGDRAKFDELVQRMQRDGVEYNEVTFGTLITNYGRWKDIGKVAEMVELLKTREGAIDAKFYSILAATYSRLGDAEGIDDAWQDLINSRLYPDTETYNHFLSLYGKHHNMPRMQSVMDSMMKHVPPNPLTATTVLDVLGKAGRITEMENLLSDMRKNPDTAPTSVTYHQAMNAYAKAGDVAKMERARDDMLAQGYEENAVTFNILAEGYGRGKRFEQLQELIRRRKDKGVPMEELGYCVLISCYGRVRLINDVRTISDELKTLKASGAPEASDVVTRKVHWALVDAFCRCGDVETMQYWVSELGELATADRAMLIAYFSRVGLMDRADEMATAIEAASEDVPFNALNALARGFAKTGRFDRSVEVLHKMRDRNLVPDASTALTLSQMFLKAGLHEQAQQIVQWRRQYSSTAQAEAENEDVIV